LSIISIDKGGETVDFKNAAAQIDAVLHPDDSFDVIRRELKLKGGRAAIVWCIDGLIDSSVLERVIEFIELAEKPLTLEYSVPFVESETSCDPSYSAIKVLSGGVAIAVDGKDDIVLIFPRNYPDRSIEEPDNEKTLRGPRDGFCERLVPNTALIRRRIKDPALKVRLFTLGSSTRTDTIMIYLENRASKKLVSTLENRLKSYTSATLSFGEQTLAEYLVKSHWYNPFPKVRYTERPDSAAAMILEGSVILMCDNSPSVMILPTSIFDFLQESNDFYLPPVTATYLRLTRLLMSTVTVFFIPLWYLLVCIAP